MHLLVKQLEALHLVDSILRALDIVIDYESLPFPLDALLCDNLEDIAELRKDFAQGFDEGRYLDALV